MPDSRFEKLEKPHAVSFVLFVDASVSAIVIVPTKSDAVRARSSW